MQRHWLSWTSVQHFPRMIMGRGCQRQLSWGLCKALAHEADRFAVGEPLCTAPHPNLAVWRLWKGWLQRWVRPHRLLIMYGLTVQSFCAPLASELARMCKERGYAL